MRNPVSEKNHRSAGSPLDQGNMSMTVHNRIESFPETFVGDGPEQFRIPSLVIGRSEVCSGSFRCQAGYPRGEIGVNEAEKGDRNPAAQNFFQYPVSMIVRIQAVTMMDIEAFPLMDGLQFVGYNGHTDCIADIRPQPVIVIAGENAGSKLEKARKLRVSLVREDEWLKIITESRNGK